MAQLVVLIVLAYLLATYGFWKIVLLAIGLTVVVLAIAFAIAGPLRPLEQPKVHGKRKGPTRSRTDPMLLVNHDGPLGRIRTGLVIDEPWISKIIGGEKDWEMRSTATTKRERIALIRKGSLSIIGVATISDVQGPFTDSQISDSFERHRVPTHMIGKCGLDPLPWTGGRLRFLMSSSLLSPDLGDQVQSSAGCGRSLWYRAA